MTCYGCGFPPWQHWFNSMGEACCCSLHQQNSHYWTPTLQQQTHSHHHFVAPCFSYAPFLHPAIRVDALNKCPKKVRRQRLKPVKNHEHKDVFENYPGLFTLPSDLDAMAALLDKERKDVREWASKRLKSQMLSRAHTLNLEVEGVRVNKFSDISKSWDKDQRDSNAKKMYEILYGDFEGANVSWSLDWEKEFLAEHGREYIKEANKDDDKKIGCYRSIITGKKIAEVKMITRNWEWKIQMAMPEEYKGVRTGRRKRGDFYVVNKAMVTKQRTVFVEGASKAAETETNRSSSNCNTSCRRWQKRGQVLM
jgi:hypothetical protein